MFLVGGYSIFPIRSVAVAAHFADDLFDVFASFEGDEFGGHEGADGQGEVEVSRGVHASMS